MRKIARAIWHAVAHATLRKRIVDAGTGNAVGVITPKFVPLAQLLEEQKRRLPGLYPPGLVIREPWLREATPEEAAEFDRLESIRADSPSSSL